MNTMETNPTPTPPANPARGNQRGQTTLAAEIDRWQALVDNLAPQIDQLPGLKDTFTQFQILVAQAKAVRNRLNILRAGASVAIVERDHLLEEGADLFTRLNLGLQSFHGPKNPRLQEFGLKPRRPRRSRKTVELPPPPPPPPQVEVAAIAAPPPPAGPEK